MYTDFQYFYDDGDDSALNAEQHPDQCGESQCSTGDRAWGWGLQTMIIDDDDDAQNSDLNFHLCKGSAALAVRC